MRKTVGLIALVYPSSLTSLNITRKHNVSTACYNIFVKAHIVKIGNSQGIRIPKTLLEQTGLSGEVVLEVTDKSIVIRAAKRPRHGWEAAFQNMAAEGDDALLDEGFQDLPDETWEW